MEKKRVSFLVSHKKEENDSTRVRRPESIAVMNPEVIKKYLKNIITVKGTDLEIDLSGIHTITNEWIDTLNFLSRLGRKYNSKISLVGVEKEVFEMIELIREHYFFDIQDIQKSK